MSRTFLSENERKNKLFESWNEYLDKLQSHFIGKQSEGFYEGSATISEVTINTFGVYLEDGTSIRHIPINSTISKSTCSLDSLYIALIKIESKWWPLEIISIGSFLNYHALVSKKEVHFSVNPRLMEEVGESVVH